MKYYLLTLLLCFNLSYGQEKKSKKISFNPESYFYIIVPNNFGENYLSRSNKPDIGIGTNLSFLKIYSFKLGMGYDYIYYTVTDITRAGNIDSSRYKSVFGTLTYQNKLFNEFYIQPYVGIGFVKLNFKAEDRNFGHQKGTEFRIGSNFYYKFNRFISPFVGVSYIATKYNINTSPEFVSFYDNSNKLQINIGLKLN